jgi:hypothetical protein
MLFHWIICPTVRKMCSTEFYLRCIESIRETIFICLLTDYLIYRYLEIPYIIVLHNIVNYGLFALTSENSIYQEEGVSD